MRIGIGYDVHRLVPGRKLMMGGVEIDYEKGLLGHSDADVLLHAIMDALLGAAALGDIGKHFPDTDPEYEGISSIKLLEHVGRLLDENGYVIENIDATVIAQRPKLAPYREEMRKKPQKVDPSFSLWNIIGAVTSRHPSLNLTNIWQMTVYQLYDQFARVRDQVAFDVYSTRWAVWGKDKLDQSLWFKQERDNKV